MPASHPGNIDLIFVLTLSCLPSLQVMNFLNELYQGFDDLVDDYGMYKLDIVGDCYIVVAGLIKEDQVRIFEFKLIKK